LYSSSYNLSICFCNSFFLKYLSTYQAILEIGVILKALVQRVREASVTVDGKVIGKIAGGLVVFVGIDRNDSQQDLEYLVDKVVNLRIFSDEKSKFNISAAEINAELLIVSQFTLIADTRKGRRPSFIDAAPPEKAESLFNLFVDRARSSGLKVEAGRFQEHMLVNIYNDGPVTILLDSRDKFGYNLNNRPV
jgi:D-tyrosyl-tRNA(Tyr) deacylase